MLVRNGSEIRIWQVEPAVAFTTLRAAANGASTHQFTSIHRDGRLVAVGTERGVILWDLAHKLELGFVPIGNAWRIGFEPAGTLLTNGDAGALRWAVRIDPVQGKVRLGPPKRLLPNGSHCGLVSDRTGRIVAMADFRSVHVALDDRTFAIGPLDDCRYLAISPDGRWLATGNQEVGGVTIWSLPDGARVVRLPFEGQGKPAFSPDGKWLVTSSEPSRLWEVGRWREVRQFRGSPLTFSPDGRLMFVIDMSRALALVETETGRILALVSNDPTRKP